MRMISNISRTIFFSLFITLSAFGQTTNPVWIHMPASTYSVKLTGMADTNTEGNTYTGVYDTDKNSHKFDVVETGWYNKYFDIAGGTNWSLDSDWSPRYVPGGDARSLDFMPDSLITTPEAQRLFTTGAKAWLTGQGLDSTYIPDEISIKLDPSDSTFYVLQPFALIDTLTQNSATPSISGGPTFVTNNTALTTITDFTDTPAATVYAVYRIAVMDDSTRFEHSAPFDCGGVDLAPDSADVMMIEWTSKKWYIKFLYID